MMAKAIEKINRENMRKTALTKFAIGDTIRVSVKIREGEKERIQNFSGIVISCKGGGATEVFTVRKISHGVGVERTFPLHSPNVAGIEVESSGQARRAKLYFLRRRSGKKAKLEEKAAGEAPVAAVLEPAPAAAPAAT